MVGLKKVIVDISGGLDVTFDMGFNFVQRFKRSEFGNVQYLVSTFENYYELSDLYHFNKWSILKKAGEACDYPYESNNFPLSTVVYNLGLALTSWIKAHFNYNDTQLYRKFTLSDEKILETITNGLYQGVCDEYTVLYVSFARAMNIPARQIYIKYKLFGLLLMGHEFAEIWNGERWIHADPTGPLYDIPTYYRAFGEVISVNVLQGADDALYTNVTYGDVTGDGYLHYWYDFEYHFTYNSTNPYYNEERE
ncbi:MAG: transglutaminase-like domain-containing protein [Candidatus Asgardarchaeia archaeon]